MKIILLLLLCGSANAGTLVTANEVSTTSVATLASTQTFTGSSTFNNAVVISSAIAQKATPVASGMYANNMIKGWAVFNGTTANAMDSFNVSTITYTSTGEYTISWDRDFSSANYAVVCSDNYKTNPHICVPSTPTAETVQITVFQPGVGNYNPTIVNVIAIGLQ